MRGMSAISRHALPRVLEALKDTRIVAIQGARQVGKTTLISDIVGSHGGRLLSFDDEQVLAFAQADPIGFLRHDDSLLAIDEVQRAPELVPALKYVVDRDRRPGRFLITGSADLLRLSSAQDSLAGRLERIELHGFSQGELAGHVETFIDRVMGGEHFVTHRSDLTREDYLQRAIAGGYPEALSRPAGRRRDAWLDSYVDGIVKRDAREIAGLQRVERLPQLLRVLAAQDSEELNIADIAARMEVPATSVHRLVDLLDTMYLTQRIPAWSTNFTKRAVSRPKVSLLDTGLAARLLGLSAAGTTPAAYSEAAGHLLEGFVAGELRRQLAWANESVRISHFRDRAAGEIDVIMEAPDGRVVGIEVKSTSPTSHNDAKWLAALRDKIGKRFVAGILLHTGPTAGPFGERITAVPMDIIWTA